MEHPEANPDPTIVADDEQFFAGALDEATEGRAKQTSGDLAPNDLKGRIGAHVFWDRSQEWWWCDWQARRLPQGNSVRTSYGVFDWMTPSPSSASSFASS